jgi:hybrid cluster-associated redox disulfide protein
MVGTKTVFTKDSVIGDIMRDKPGAAKVIEKYFGNGCFTCAGMKVEPISFGAMMHNMDADAILKEINELED